ncbi:triose-phosphate isomerase [Selenomonas sp. TAMA-11512]|uniref:triose-phosphate isomerase n=1 Tax=Selenomonas sp. TAMA-11512 TaxID=3095337 RepID=UPI003092F905|nr:triose-phosphate isomerase [Selenomonas sp. TAMA-11512]
MYKKEAFSPFMAVNPKSYFWGKTILELALQCDKIAEETGVTIYFTCPFTDIRMVKEATKIIQVTAQGMEALRPGRGIGHILPESLKEAGADAVFLNHAENPMTISELYRTMRRAKELDIFTIVCADSVAEAKAIAMLEPDIVLAEPTDLIGTGETADDSYIKDTVREIRAVDPDVGIMIASGITTAEDCYRVVALGADGTGSTSGVVKADNPAQRVREMCEAVKKAHQTKEQ